jgi:hypothetical protein
VDVEERHVDVAEVSQGPALYQRPAPANHFEVRLPVQDKLEGPAEGGVIFDEQKA